MRASSDSRLQKTDSSTGNEGYTYNAANMLLTRGTGSYTNDLNGNTLTAAAPSGTRTCVWDSENRMVSCAYNGNNCTYTYGADGIRRQSVVNGVRTDYVLDNSMFVQELRAGSPIATYLMGPRGPDYRRNDAAGTVRWYLYDGLGSVLGGVDPSGNLTCSRKYDVYGAVRSFTGTQTSKHRFVGALGHPSEDETGLIYMQARYMDPTVGRFVSEDPGRNGGNWFGYCHGNPVSGFDRDGKDDEFGDGGPEMPDYELPGTAAAGELFTWFDIMYWSVVTVYDISWLATLGHAINAAKDSLAVELAWGEFMGHWARWCDPSSMLNSDILGSIGVATNMFGLACSPFGSASGIGAATNVVIMFLGYDYRLEWYINAVDTD